MLFIFTSPKSKGCCADRFEIFIIHFVMLTPPPVTKRKIGFEVKEKGVKYAVK
ncbi:MAG: hypothetical protein WC557_11800 [Ignavibacteriaceae bacterium]